MRLLEELNERYKTFQDEAATLDERRQVLMLAMNELLPAIWALEAEEEKAARVNSESPKPLAADIDLPPGFTKWEGGECPVPHGKIVDIICRDPDVRVGQTNQVFAHMISWANEGNSAYDIIAYRIIEASSQPETDALGQAGVEVETPSDYEPNAIEPETGLHEEPAPDLDALMSSGEHSYDEVAQIAYPETTDGYAPVVAKRLTDEEVAATLERITTEAVAGLELPQDTVATQTYMDGEKVIVRAISANEMYEATPPTNPEADALAAAHDYYAPENVAKRDRFNPFTMFHHKREKEDA